MDYNIPGGNIIMKPNIEDIIDEVLEEIADEISLCYPRHYNSSHCSVCSLLEICRKIHERVEDGND